MCKNKLLSPFRDDNRAYLKKRIKALYNKNPHCYYCKRFTYRNTTDPNLDALATVEHLYSKMDIRRFLVSKDKNTVLACNKCNQDRGNLDGKIYLSSYTNSIGWDFKYVDIKDYAYSVRYSRFIRIRERISKFIQNLFL